jgi:hypothetical protein
MTTENWELKGNYYESCRVLDGHCGLVFNRDLPPGQTCANILTYQIKEGHIQNVDMKDIVITCHLDGIGPTLVDLFEKGVEEGAYYISENATDQQRKILEPFVMKHLEGKVIGKLLGIKYVKYDISQKNGTYHLSTPFWEQEMSVAIGGDGKNPIILVNGGLPPSQPTFHDMKICTTRFWKYHDYGKNLEYHNTSGAIAGFTLKGP